MFRLRRKTSNSFLQQKWGEEEVEIFMKNQNRRRFLYKRKYSIFYIFVLFLNDFLFILVSFPMAILTFNLFTTVIAKIMCLFILSQFRFHYIHNIHVISVTHFIIDIFYFLFNTRGFVFLISQFS